MCSGQSRTKESPCSSKDVETDCNGKAKVESEKGGCRIPKEQAGDTRSGTGGIHSANWSSATVFGHQLLWLVMKQSVISQVWCLWFCNICTISCLDFADPATK